MPSKPLYAGPPWAAPDQWAEANAALLRLCDGLAARGSPARSLAAELAGALIALGPAMERLCAATCPRCIEPCCLRARVWLDFADLLFMHLSGQALPVAQLRAAPEEACRYLGAKGCGLPRLSRPWVCTWYLCPEQKQRMAAWSEGEKKEVEQGLEKIKRLRKEMEGEAVEVR